MGTWRELVAQTPDVLHGQARFRGTRIPVAVVLDNLAEGVEPEAIHEAYPTLPKGAIEAALKYAAELARKAPTEVA